MPDGLENVLESAQYIKSYYTQKKNLWDFRGFGAQPKCENHRQFSFSNFKFFPAFLQKLEFWKKTNFFDWFFPSAILFHTKNTAKVTKIAPFFRLWSNKKISHRDQLKFSSLCLTFQSPNKQIHIRNITTLTNNISNQNW